MLRWCQRTRAADLEPPSETQRWVVEVMLTASSYATGDNHLRAHPQLAAHTAPGTAPALVPRKHLSHRTLTFS
jgi:hypothetical protein